MRGQPGYNKRPHLQLSPSYLGMDAWMALQLNAALIRKLRGSLMCLASINVLSMSVYNQALAFVGRLVQELDVLTVSSRKNMVIYMCQLHLHRIVNITWSHVYM